MLSFEVGFACDARNGLKLLFLHVGAQLSQPPLLLFLSIALFVQVGRKSVVHIYVGHFLVSTLCAFRRHCLD
jgi:hypothetical protein